MYTPGYTLIPDFGREEWQVLPTPPHIERSVAAATATVAMVASQFPGHCAETSSVTPSVDTSCGDGADFGEGSDVLESLFGDVDLDLLNSVLGVELPCVQSLPSPSPNPHTPGRHPMTLPMGPRMNVTTTASVDAVGVSTVESAKRSGLPPRSPAVRKRQRGHEACLGCGLSVAGPSSLLCLGRLSEAAESPMAGYGSASPHSVAGSDTGDLSDKRSRPRTTGKGLCERFEDAPDTVVSVASSCMYVVAGDVKSQVLRIMYTKWGVLAHDKLRMPGDPKAVAFTVLVFGEDAARDTWLSNYGPGKGNRKYSFTLQPWEGFVVEHGTDWVEFYGEGSRLVPSGVVQWRSCRVHRLRTGPGKYIGKMCMLSRFPGGKLRAMHDKCLDCYPHRIKTSFRASPASTPSGSTVTTEHTDGRVLVFEARNQAAPGESKADAGDLADAVEAPKACIGCVVKLGVEAAVEAACDVPDGKFVCNKASAARRAVSSTLFVVASKALFYGEGDDVNAPLDARDVALTLRQQFSGVVAVHVLPAMAAGAAAMLLFDTDRDADDALLAAMQVPGLTALGVEVWQADKEAEGGEKEVAGGSLMWTACTAAATAAGGDAKSCASFGFGMCPILMSAKHSLVATDGANVALRVPMAVNRRDKATKTMSCSHCTQRVEALDGSLAKLCLDAA